MDNGETPGGPHRAVRRARPRRPPIHGVARPLPSTVPGSAPERFRSLDRYRVDREWQRYEGTPQRDLFRELRIRFLARHAPAHGWSVDVGSGPGRFGPSLGGDPSRRVLLDLSREMLRQARARWPPTVARPHLVRGDGQRPPLRAGSFDQVTALGNPLGFAGGQADELLVRLQSLVGPKGTLLLEVVPGNGERSRYLARLPPGAVRRLLAAPLSLVRSRAEREGFDREPAPHRKASDFHRHDPAALLGGLERDGFRIDEVLSVAPCLGSEPDRVAAVRGDPRGWARLLELEEEVGRRPARRAAASALLVSATRPG